MKSPEHSHSSASYGERFKGLCPEFLRVLPYLLLVAGFYLFGHAVYDDHRGIAAPPYVPVRYSHPVERRDTNPELFQALMSYEWECAFPVLIAGLVLLGIVRRADRSDPLSPSFSGGSALDECERELDAELRRRRGED
jgi:hypothetical protein